MSGERPTREELRQGMTVEIEQDGENDQPIRGEIGTIRTEERTHPGGIEVQLKSGAVGRVRRVVADE